MKREEVSGATLLLLFGGVTVVLSLRMPLGTFRSAGTGLFPFLLGILLMVLSLLHLGNIYYQERKKTEKKESSSHPVAPPKQLILFFGMMVLATLFLKVLGYPLVAFLLMVSLLRTLGMKRWTLNLLISFLAATASFFLFVQWLQIPLPKGWIGL